MVSWWWKGVRTTTATRSMSGWRAIWRWSWKARRAPKYRADSAAVSGWAVQTAVSSYSGRERMAGMWAVVPQPRLTLAPMMPTRILCWAIWYSFCLGLVFPTRPPCHVLRDTPKPPSEGEAPSGFPCPRPQSDSLYGRFVLGRLLLG